MRLDVRQCEVNGEASSTVTVFRSLSYSVPAKYARTTRVRAPVCVPPPVNVDDVMNPEHSVTNRGLGGRGFLVKCGTLEQCFSTAGPRPGTGPWHQLYRAARGSPGICVFSFLSNFHE